MSDEAGQRTRSLLEQAKAEGESRESPAMESLIKEHFPAVDAFLRTRLGKALNEDDRESYFLDVLFWYVRHPERYDASRPLGVLLCAAARRNAARDSLRRRPDQLTDPLLADHTFGGMDRELARVDDRDMLNTVARVLEATDQQILLTPKDDPNWAANLASDLGLSPNAIAKRWQRIREKVQKHF